MLKYKIKTDQLIRKDFYDLRIIFILNINFNNIAFIFNHQLPKLKSFHQYVYKFNSQADANAFIFKHEFLITQNIKNIIVKILK